MDILLWIIFGAIVGWLTSAITNTGGGLLWDILLGIVGAVIGGFIMNLLGLPGVMGFNLYSFIVAILGAMVIVYLGHMFRRSSY